MADIKDRAREYLAEHSEYSEVFGGTFIAVDTFTAMVEFAEQETKELKEQISIKDILIKELQEQKVYWKESSFDWRHKFFKLDKVKRLIKKDKQLNKAKNLLKWALHSDPEHDEDFEKKWEEAEQFLSEVEK